MDSVLVLDVPEEAARSVAFLADRGYAAEATSDPYRAVEVTSRSHPAAVIVRANLGALEDPDLVTRLKAGSRDSRVIVLMDETDAGAAASLVLAGADALLAGVGPDFLVWTLTRVKEGGLVLSPEIGRAVAEEFAAVAVRSREWGRELAARAREAEELAQAKSDFLGNVSHELRTPLTIIKGLASILRRTGEPTGDEADFLSQLEEAADKLTGVVEGLLTQAEIRRGEFSLVAQECDLAEVIREGAADCQRRYPNVSLEVDVPDHVPAVADVRGIREVVRQIVDNACRFSEPGSSVTVKASHGPEGINVHVTDQGVGLQRKQIAAAFGQPFAPGENVLTKERSGLGIGLHLARNLVGLHGGILWAEPLPGGGSRVSFTLPTRPPVEGPVETGSSTVGNLADPADLA